MRIQLSDHFTTGKLLRFVAPSIVMMIFTSVYGAVSYTHLDVYKRQEKRGAARQVPGCQRRGGRFDKRTHGNRFGKGYAPLPKRAFGTVNSVQSMLLCFFSRSFRQSRF